MDRQQKIELLKGILEGRRSITEVMQKHLWIITLRKDGNFTNPDTGKKFRPSEYEAEVQQARLRHAGKKLCVLRITTRGKGMNEQDALERIDYPV